MITLHKGEFVNVNNQLYTLLNNKWVVCLSVQYNSNNTITVYSIQYITK